MKFKALDNLTAGRARMLESHVIDTSMLILLTCDQ